MQRLELTWIGKNVEPRLEPRILLENPEYRSGQPNTDGDWQGMLIHGDNLLALKALEQDFAGKIKCIYIDPPYNTGSAFEHYDDGIEHSLWLSLIRDRLKILKNLLRDDGSIWISIDDNECHYLKVLCDEVFGRGNFVANVVWEKKYSPQNDTKWLSDSHDHILVFANNKDKWRPYLLPRTIEMNDRYKNPDNDPRGVWKSTDFSVKTYSASNDYPIELPSGRTVTPPESRCWVSNKSRFLELVKDNRIWFGKDGNSVPSLKKFLTEVKDGSVSKTIWFRTEVGDNQEAKKEIKDINNSDVFSTPKPERLIERILFMASQVGDLVLDSFLGSGTTAAVAHKMGRRWIGIELGAHAHTHCLPRLRKVVRGEDQGGISKAVGWQGGGGFRCYTLAPSLLRQDPYGQWVISQEYDAQMLAAAVAKHEGFRYDPDAALWWKQSRSSERDWLLVTTQYVNRPLLDSIAESMAEDDTLLICCKAFDKNSAALHPNISVKKIPNLLVNRCEYGRDDYSLHIVNVPVDTPEADAWSPPDPTDDSAPGGRKTVKKLTDHQQGKLF